MQGLACTTSQLQRIKELTNNICQQECDIIRFFEICPDMLCIVDGAGVIAQVNNAWHETLRWVEEDLVGQPVINFVHGNDADEMHGILRSMRESQIVRFYTRAKIKNSEAFLPIEWTAALSTDGNICMSAREIPELCLECRRARLMKK